MSKGMSTRVQLKLLDFQGRPSNCKERLGSLSTFAALQEAIFAQPCYEKKIEVARPKSGSNLLNPAKCAIELLRFVLQPHPAISKVQVAIG